MASLKIKPCKLQGKLDLPSSKSHTMRALIFGCMAEGPSLIHHYLPSPDSEAMVGALRQFGCELDIQGTSIKIKGGGLKKAPGIIDAGNSGQVLRFIGALAALFPEPTILTGDYSICNRRPVTPLLEALSQLGARAHSQHQNGKAPIQVSGPMRAGRAYLNGADSQPISALLIAGSFLKGTTELFVTDAGEKPWIEMTLSWLKNLGGRVEHQNFAHYCIGGSLKYEGFELTIPGDLSSLSFPLTAALVTGSPIEINNVDLEDCQGDKKIVSILTSMGATFCYEVETKKLAVLPSKELEGTLIDVNDCIDALPILAVIGCFAKGKTLLKNGWIARYKESDRLHAITVELKKMGAKIKEYPDGLEISQSSLKGAHLSSHNDHRIALALAVAAMGAEGESHISESHCISKSYPHFVQEFQKIGALIEEA